MPASTLQRRMRIDSSVHDVGTHEGSPVIVSELLQGELLREKLGRP